MKNIWIAGSIIGILSGVWLSVLYMIGYATFFNDVLLMFTSGKPFKEMGILVITAVLIPVTGLCLGLKLYKQHKKGGEITFAGSFATSLRILIIGGLLALVFGLIYRHVIAKGPISEFVKLSIGALLLGLTAALILSFLLKSRSK